MAKNPLTVGGFKAIIDKIADQASQSAKEAASRRREGQSFHTRGFATLDGQFAFDNEGNLGVVGNIIGPVGAVAIEVNPELHREWDTTGDGHIKIHFEISIDSEAAESEA